MSKQLSEINAALQGYRVLLSAYMNPGQAKWRKAAELVTLSFQIEKLALDLDEGVKQIAGIIHIAGAQQKLQQAYNLVNEVSQACENDLSLAVAGCEALRDLSKFQKLLSESLV
ncbi:MAG: hypothetical protein CVV11_19950 [Gammaproteobacteria bacterium HGW-Gammaproteobacteria-15]|nr:MAG: hypothetical protein CVV11_19950 [Gammaproteobacteria bacterium HGW-Gammaproteobacteria-15]